MKQDSFSFVLNLDKITIPNIKKIVKVPDIEEVVVGKKELFAIKFFVTIESGKMFIFRVTSEDKKFNTIYSIDFLNEKHKPVKSLIMNNKLTKAKFLEMISFLGKEKSYVSKKFVNKLTKEDYNLSEETPVIDIDIDSKVDKMMNKLMFVQILLPLISLIFIFYFYIKEVINNIKELEAETRRETQTNLELFSKQTGNEPEFIIYKKIEEYLKTVIDKKMNGLLLYGPPGVSKTYIVRRTIYFSKLKPAYDYKIAKGSTLGLLSFYQMLYECRNKLLILDDFDKPLLDEDIVNLLKAATDSYKNRIVALPLEKMMSRGGERTASSTPQKFSFEGRIIILTNLTRDKMDKAILSRIPSIEVNFKPETLIKNIESMLKYMNPSISLDEKQEVFNYIMSLYKKNKNVEISFRSVKSSIDAKVCNPKYWKEMVQVIVNYN